MEHIPRKSAEPFSKSKRCKQWLVSKGNFIMEHEKMPYLYGENFNKGGSM